jgi:CheY-like chemotaxis protein
MTTEMIIPIVVGGLFGSGGLILWLLEHRAKAKAKKAEKEDTLSKGIRLIIQNNIRLIAFQQIERKKIPIAELDLLMEMYECYKELGGNGMMEHLMREVGKLPVGGNDDREKDEATKRAEQKTQELPIVLTVDDSLSSLNVIHNALKDLYRVHTLREPLEITPYLKRITPQLILLDYLMPDATGLDLIPIIRKFPEHCDTPIIMLSGEDSSETMSAALELGVSAFVTKPFTATELRAAVAKYIRK